MPKPRKKRSLTGTEDRNDKEATTECSQRSEDSDMQKTESSASSDSPVVKRAKVGKVKERQYDKYCWVCHFEDCSEKCSFCPRVYHTSCLSRLENTIGDWTCPECQAVVIAEKNRSTSPVMSLLSTDQLCNLLKYSLNRMEMHVPKDFCFGSSSSVFYPMDFPLLEKNIRKKAYTSPAAFLADAKWIFHNHSVYFPLCVPAVKTIMKVCQEEMREIETCPDCYLHAYSMKDKWFSEPCRKPHTLVWAKLKGFPIWPAKAVKTSNGNVDVRFFGGHERAWVPVTHCYFLSRDPPQAISSQKRNFECAHQEVELHIKLLSQRFGGFEYAPEKTPFNPSQIYLNLNVTLSKLSYLPQSLRDKRKQEMINFPAKRRLNRTNSAHEVQGNRKDEEKKEVNVVQSLVEKDQIDKMNDCHSEKDKSASLPSLIDTAKSCEEKCVIDDTIIQLQENANSIKDPMLLSEKTYKEENDNSETKKESSNEVSVIPLEPKNNSKEQNNKNDSFQNETEIPSSIETNALEEIDIAKNYDQENTTILEITNNCTGNQVCTANSTNQEKTFTIQYSQSVINTSEDYNKHDKNIADEVLDNANNMSVIKELGQNSTKILIGNNEHSANIINEVLADSNNVSLIQKPDQDSTKISINTINCTDKNNSIEVDLHVTSELIIDMSTIENEDNHHDIKPIDNKNIKNENKPIDTNHPDDKKNTKEVKLDEEQAEPQIDFVSVKQSNDMPAQATDFKISEEKSLMASNSSLSSNGTSLQNIKEVVIVIEDLQEGNKKLIKENNVIADSTTADSTPNILKDQKENVASNKNPIEDDKVTEMINSTNICGKSIINTKEDDTKKVANITDSSVKTVAYKARRASVHKRDKHTEDMLKADNKLDEKNEFHVDDSHLENTSLSSNSLRIRIVKGKVGENPHCSSTSKDSEDIDKTVSKTAKMLQEETIVNSSKGGFLQNSNNNEGPAKSEAQKPEQVFENTIKQGTVVTSTASRKTKRPRKNFIIQFPQKPHQINTHSNQDNRDSSSAVILQDDCEANANTSNHPDEPDIVKNFKATFEKIHKVKYTKGSVLEKVIDYKSHSPHLNDVQRIKSVKLSTNLTNSPVVIKVPSSNISENIITSSIDCIPSSSVINQVSQIPCSKISSTKSLQIIAIDNRSTYSNPSTVKYSDPSQSCNVLHKQTEVSHCSNLDNEHINNKGETSATKTLNIRDQIGAEVTTQDKCSNMNMLLQNVQVSLKETSVLNHKESNATAVRSETDAQNLNQPPSDKERNLFNILPVEKYARKLTVFLTNTLEEMCQDIINSGCMQVAVHSLETELENLREKHKTDLADVKQNAELVLKEMRTSMETEKQNAVAEVKRQCEMEMRKNVEEAKKKQWCANCGKEAVFYCCWNTSYCDYPCQQTHWPQHMSICGQNHVPPVKEQQIVRMPNLGSDMTITQSSPGLPLEIQLTTHSPTQTNKNKKKPSSSNEKIPIAPRGKGRNLSQSPNPSLQPHDITRSSHVIYSPHYRLQGGQVIPVMLSHTTPHQQPCGPNVVMENKSHNVQHTVPFPFNPHACM